MLKQILEEDQKQSPEARSFSPVWSWGWLVVLLGWIGWTVSTHLAKDTFRGAILGTAVLLPCALLFLHVASSFSWPTWVRISLHICTAGCLAGSVYLSNHL